jgi:peptidyl-prolyl cis-trans isomerase B (cyclophilin B)
MQEVLMSVPLLLALSVLSAACGSNHSADESEGSAGQESAASPGASEPAPSPGSETQAKAIDEIAVLEVARFGTIRLEFLPDKAPGHVENFKKLARQGFYDGTTFHRVIPGFMIQGGDPNSKDRDPRNDGQGGPGYSIKAEFNDTPHARGVLSMARSQNPDSAGSQFFIVHQDANHLDGQYTAFGRVIEGMDVVDAITATERDQYGRYGPRDRPIEDVVIESVRIVPREH